jgi:hypothetical protein
MKPDFVRSQTIGFFIKTLKNLIVKNQGLPPLVIGVHNIILHYNEQNNVWYSMYGNL